MSSARSDAALVREMTRRILRSFNAASAADALEGADWYASAADVSAALAAGSGLTFEQCAGVIAALSPRCKWNENLRAAGLIVAAASGGVAAPIVCGTLGNRAKAWAIANGGDPAAILGGPKVRAFYANICGDTSAVCVDVWAARAAEGRSDDRAADGRRYKRIARAYERAADIAGVTPRDMQATVWVAIRRQAHGKAS